MRRILERNVVGHAGRWTEMARLIGMANRLMLAWIRMMQTPWLVGGNRSHNLHGNALAFAEKWKENQRDKSVALQDDGNCYCTLLDTASALFGLRIAFDKAVAE
jgi:hypothetical protein